MLTIYPKQIRMGSSAFVTFRGTPGRALTWELIGDGELQEVVGVTDARGLATAVFVPGSDDQTIEVRVSYVL